MKQQLTSPPRKPKLDEGSFQQLLSAAHVIQEHNDRLLTNDPQADSAEILAEIVETQKLVMTGQLDLQGVASLIAARLQRITNSTGAAIGILQKDQLIYLAGVGSAASETGAQVLLNSSLSAACLQTGQILRCSNLATGPQRPSEPRRDNTVRSLIVVPIHRDGKVAGVVELRFSEIDAFTEDDVRTCELMAALLTDTLARADELDEQESLAAQRAEMLQVLEKIKPQLERLVGEPITNLGEMVFPGGTVPTAKAPAKKTSAPPPTASSKPIAPVAPPTTLGKICRGCGKEFAGDEAFCGNCGMTRTKPGGDNSHLQSKWASLWYMQQAAGQAEVKRDDRPSPASGQREKEKPVREAPVQNKLPVASPLPSVPAGPLSLGSFAPIAPKEKMSPPAPATPRKTVMPRPPIPSPVAPPVLAKENFAPRFPVSLEDIVAQFAAENETDLIPKAQVQTKAWPVEEISLMASDPDPVVLDPVVLDPVANEADVSDSVVAEPVVHPPVVHPRIAKASPLLADAPVTGAVVPHEEVVEEKEIDWKLSPSVEHEAEIEPELESEAQVYEEASLVIRNPLGGDETRDQASSAVVKTSPWTSAANARRWLESLGGQSPTQLWISEQWRRHRSSIYLGAAGLIFVAALVSLFTQPAPAVRKNPAEPQLTAFERLMVNLGLAEAPPVPVYLGNPDRQVWVDLHTALYYCPATDLYGKTAGGRYETQRSAQLDQFEPASRRACD